MVPHLSHDLPFGQFSNCRSIIPNEVATKSKRWPTTRGKTVRSQFQLRVDDCLRQFVTKVSAAVIQ